MTGTRPHELHNPLREWDLTTKGLRLGPDTRLEAADIQALGWNALRGDLDFPVMLVHEAALRHNIDLLADYCARVGVSLAPHAKTAMSPEITQRQLDVGAWAVTAATPGQLRTLHAFGVRQLLLANVLVDVEAIRWVRDALLTDDDVTFHCYVDSLAGVTRMERVLEESTLPRKLPVLVELGYPGGRTGLRSVEDALALAERVRASASLALAGVAGFEGLIPGDATCDFPPAVDAFLLQMRRLVELVHEGGLLASSPPVVTVGGSAYFDRVVEVLGPQNFAFPVTVVLRSGCYVTHDHGLYRGSSPLDQRGTAWDGGRLKPALELLASVWSRPEPDLLIVGFGRRDVPTDAGMPVVLRNHGQRTGDLPVADCEVVAVNDQHAFVRIPRDSDISVGDLLGFGVSHPCGAFDRWRLICAVDEDYDVVGSLTTFLS